MGDRIEVRFTFQGKELRPTLPLKPTAANLKHAARQRADIIDEIKAGTFKLSAYFPDYKFAERHQAPDASHGRTLKDWADVWEKLAARDLEHSTLRIYRRHLDAYWLTEFGGMAPHQITYERVLGHLADLAESRELSRKTQNNILIPLRAVFDLIGKTPGAPPNPTDGIDNLKVQTGDPDPFTAEEIELALAQVRKSDAAMADYFEFSCFAGLRPSEQIALLWTDVDLRTSTVLVQRVRVLGKDKARTKTHKARTVELNGRAAAVLERQRARTQLLGGEVFINPTMRRPYVDEQFQARAWMSALRLCGIRHRPPKELRDTSVTMSLQAGADPYYVAAQHGHSVTTMMKDYAKFIPKADGGRNLAAINRSLGIEPDKKESTK